MFKILAIKLVACLALAGASSSVCHAQQTNPASPDPSVATQPKSPKEQDSPKDNPSGIQPQQPSNKPNSGGNQDQNATSNDRLMFALPNFLTLENGGHVPPLTTKQKFAVVARGSFDPVIVVWYGFLSGISQAENSEPGFGQGAEGYAKRYGASFADGTIENFTTQAIFPTVLRQDPRFFQLGHGSIAHRALYAVSRNVVTRGDSGKTQFNFSEIVGGAVAATISTYSYHPKGQYVSTPTGPEYIQSDRTISNTAKVWGAQYGYDTLTLVIKEFWPDIRRAMTKHKANGEGKTTTPAQ